MDPTNGQTDARSLVPACKLNIPVSLPVQEGFRNVLVLSKTFKLTFPQYTLLNRGLSFIPTKGINSGIKEQGRWDIQQYHRRLKLAVHYEGAEDDAPPPFTPKSDWTPPDGRLPPEVATLVRADMKYFNDSFQTCQVKSNLSSDETRALKELRENRHIIIKPADKGSAVVIMDREQYLWEGYRQLSDRTYYTKLDNPIFPDTIPLVHKIVNSLHQKKFISNKQKKYLLNTSEPRPRFFYLLPKIHKDPAKWSKPFEIPPGRPIVSDCSSETYCTAEFIDHYLNPLSTTHPSYIKDTYHFVEVVRGLHIPQEAMLFTLDVDSLYTNIDTTEGMQVIKEKFQQHPDKKRPDKELLQLLEINLTRNDFQFNNEYFLQVKGTAMGKKFAPAYANIFMAHWETSALASCEKKPLYYFRYLDDIWGIWVHTEEDFQKFLFTLNNHNSSIKVKSTTSPTSVDFLDTTTYKGQNFENTHTLDIKVFFKETDTHALLHKHSFHPKHTYAGLIKSQLLRFNRICSHKDDFIQATKVLFAALRSRGYSRSFLRRSYKTFLQPRTQLQCNILPFVATYSPSSVKLIHMARTNFHKILCQADILPEHRIIAALRKNKNLQDHLVKAKIPSLNSAGTKGQGDFFRQLTWVQNRRNQTIFKIDQKGNVHTKNCVYLITCTKCGIQYVGETGNTLLLRFTQHRYNILRHKQTHTPLVKHFSTHGWHSVQASVLESNSRWSGTERLTAERRWILRLDTIQPRGLNEK